MAVLHGMCHELVLCVDVICVKTCCFVTNFMAVGHFSSEGTNIEKVDVCVGLPFSILRFLTLGKLGTQNAKGSELASHTVCQP